jgi:hypothetical protein
MDADVNWDTEGVIGASSIVQLCIASCYIITSSMARPDAMESSPVINVMALTGYQCS